MLNLNLKKLTRIAVVLGAIILIMGTIATIGAFADSSTADKGSPAVTAEDSGDGYIAEAGNDAAASPSDSLPAAAASAWAFPEARPPRVFQGSLRQTAR